MTALGYDILSGLAAGKPASDHPCPECGPDRSTRQTQRKPTLRVWHDGAFATYHCARCGVKGWGRQDGAKAPPPERIAEIRREADEREAVRRKDVSARAMALWSEAEPASPTHPYLSGKKLQPVEDLRQRGGLLVAPMQAPGVLLGAQTINASGRKRFLRGSVLRGSYFPIGGGWHNGDRLVIAEGVATALAVNQSTDLDTAAAFAANRRLKGKVKCLTPSSITMRSKTWKSWKLGHRRPVERTAYGPMKLATVSKTARKSP